MLDDLQREEQAVADEIEVKKTVRKAGRKAAEAVEDEEIGIVFEAAMQMLLADSELSRAEVSNLLVIAEALGIEEEDAILMLADMVKSEPDLTINMAD